MRKLYLEAKHAVRRWRIFFSFLAVCLFNLLLLALFDQFNFSGLEVFFNSHSGFIDFLVEHSVEVWLGLLTLVLGTLIIVISIASQNTPKLIDFYVSDWISLFFTWSLVINAVLTLLVLGYGKSDTSAFSYSTFEVFLVGVMLPLHYLLSLPYILYILKFSKTENQVKRIYYRVQYLLHELNMQYQYNIEPKNKWIDLYQIQLINYINQMDELLDFIKLKESRDVIIRTLGNLLVKYQIQKSQIPMVYFTMGESLKKDATMVTLFSEFADINKNRIFLEQKIYRIIGNAYWRLIQEEEFELANRCTTIVADTGIEAVQHQNWSVVELSLIRFNNFTRFGLKHAIKLSERRHLYNSSFQYGRLIAKIIESENFKAVEDSIFYLKKYAQEIYKASLQDSHLSLLTDIYAQEINLILFGSYHRNAPRSTIMACIDALYAIEHSRDTIRRDIDPLWIKTNNTLDVQINALLFLLAHNESDYFEALMRVFLSDLQHVGIDIFNEMVDTVINKVRESTQMYWEDSDRGRTNIFYSEHKDQLPYFLEHLRERLPVVTP